MESVSSFKMNMVTENYWLIYAAATVILFVSQYVTCIGHTRILFANLT